MFCNYCRALNPNDAVYCSACGQRILPPTESTKKAQNAQAGEAKPRLDCDGNLTKPPDKETAPARVRSAEMGNQSENVGHVSPSKRTNSTESPVPELSSWEYEKMRDEELEQLQAAYQKVRVPMNQALQRELERRSLKHNSHGKAAPSPGSPAGISCETESHPISFPNSGISQSETISHAVPETKEDSSSAKPQPESSLVLPVYGTMGQRFTAYFADLIVIYLIVFGVYFVSAAFHLPLSASEGESQVVTFLALFVYMVVAQISYHTTVGKYVHGLEVCSERPTRKYPAFWRILLRETVGRLFSCFFWGAGYWLAIRKAKKQAWSDELAGTVVTARPTNQVLRRGLTAFVLVAFVLDVGAIGYGLYKEDRDKRYAAFNTEIEAATKDFVATRDAVNQRVNETKPVNDLVDFVLWQDQMKSLKTDLDQYENQIDRMQSLLQKGITENLAASETERNQYVKLREVYDLRKRQAEKLRREADLVINCDGKRVSMLSLQNDLRLLDSDIQGFEHQASELLAEIGIK